jgi:hypothetical protein
MNVTTVANGQYAAYQPNTINKTSNFDDILQERLQKPQEPSANLKPILYDMSGGQAVAVKPWHDISSDPELFAYARQLAAELGIIKNNEFAGNFKIQGMEFYGTLQELLDEGSISKKDIIDAVKNPPKVHFNNGHNDEDGFSIETNFKGFEDTKPIEYSSSSELFEILWGKEKTAS